MVVKFDEERHDPIDYRFKDKEGKGITGWFIKSGIVKTKHGANMLMIGLSMLIILLGFLIL